MNPTHRAVASGTRPTVFICGERARGDDGVAHAVAAALPRELRASATLVDAGALDITALLALPDAAACVVIDAVAGVIPGTVVEMTLAELARIEEARDVLSPAGRSTHLLSLTETLRLAAALRGRPVLGSFLGIGVADCRLGAPLSPPVAAAVPVIVERLRETLFGPVGIANVAPVAPKAAEGAAVGGVGAQRRSLHLRSPSDPASAVDQPQATFGDESW